MERSFRTEWLPQIRAALETTTQLKELLGPVARFELVIDTNILVADVIWLVSKRKHRDIKPALLECIIAGTIRAHITPKVAEEVERVLLEIAFERNLSGEAWLHEWRAYKKLINIHEGDPAVLAKYLSGADPDDAPTLALAETLCASGVVSKDRHIRMMGGTVIPVEFVYDVRGYSRKACISLSIKLCGQTLVVGAVVAAQLTAILFRQAASGLARLPAPMKFLLVAGASVVMVNPKSRAAVSTWIQSALKSVRETSPVVFDWMIELAELAVANQAIAPELPVALWKNEQHYRAKMWGRTGRR